jgi:adenine-specific DNA-methyltransferase
MKSINDFTNHVIQGDCIQVLKELPPESVDLVITDPPYMADYHSRDGRGFANEDNHQWLQPAFAEIYRVLKNNAYCVSFYGWHKVNLFMHAWRKAGFHTLEQLIWIKDYPSSVEYVARYHEAAYLLGKGKPAKPNATLPSVMMWEHTGNRRHPTEKPVTAVLPLVMAYSAENDIVLDPFCGSGSILYAAKVSGRNYIGVEMVEQYARTAQQRTQGEVEDLLAHLKPKIPVTNK